MYVHAEQVAEVELLEADITHEPSLASMAAAAEVVVCTTGPYSTYGRPVVKVCSPSFIGFYLLLLAQYSQRLVQRSSSMLSVTEPQGLSIC